MDFLYSDWESVSYCQSCGNINTYDGAYITCSNCGSTSHKFVPLRNIYEKTKFLHFFSYNKKIGYELKFMTGIKRFLYPKV
jgi:hypothetical protein